MAKPDRILNGQPYWSGTSKPHIRRDGAATTLIEWKSHCADCGAMFVFWLPARGSKFEPNRRCSQHKRPGSGKAGGVRAMMWVRRVGEPFALPAVTPT